MDHEVNIIGQGKASASLNVQKANFEVVFTFFSVLFALSFCFSRSDLETLGSVNECIVICSMTRRVEFSFEFTTFLICDSFNFLELLFFTFFGRFLLQKLYLR